jgi:catechol 2,3-dioxygenase-like lactoylglutathione lyase family enzyme
MSDVLGIAEAVLYADDLERATESNTQLLGLPLTAAFDEARFLQTGRHSTLILFNAEGTRRRTSAIPNHGATGDGHVALAVRADEIGAWRERLQRLGVAIEQDQTWSYASQSISFRGTDYNSLELITDDHYPTNWERHVGSDAKS